MRISDWSSDVCSSDLRCWRQCPAPLPDPRSDVDSSYPPYRSSAGSKPKPLPILQNTQNHAIAYSDLYENSIMLRIIISPVDQQQSRKPVARRQRILRILHNLR